MSTKEQKEMTLWGKINLFAAQNFLSLILVALVIAFWINTFTLGAWILFIYTFIYLVLLDRNKALGNQSIQGNFGTLLCYFSFGVALTILVKNFFIMILLFVLIRVFIIGVGILLASLVTK